MLYATFDSLVGDFVVAWKFNHGAVFMNSDISVGIYPNEGDDGVVINGSSLGGIESINNSYFIRHGQSNTPGLIRIYTGESYQDPLVVLASDNVLATEEITFTRTDGVIKVTVAGDSEFTYPGINNQDMRIMVMNSNITTPVNDFSWTAETTRSFTPVGTIDNTADSPTDGDSVYGDYATLNPLYPDIDSITTFSNGNKTATNSAAFTKNTGLTFAVPTSEDKIYYCEFISTLYDNDQEWAGVARPDWAYWNVDDPAQAHIHFN